MRYSIAVKASKPFKQSTKFTGESNAVSSTRQLWTRVFCDWAGHQSIRWQGRPGGSERNYRWLYRFGHQPDRHRRHLHQRKVGRALWAWHSKGKWDKVMLATKVCHPMGEGNDRAAPRAITWSTASKPVCAVCRPTTSISIRSIVGMRTRRLRRPCGRWTIWSQRQSALHRRIQLCGVATGAYQCHRRTAQLDALYQHPESLPHVRARPGTGNYPLLRRPQCRHPALFPVGRRFPHRQVPARDARPRRLARRIQPLCAKVHDRRQLRQARKVGRLGHRTQPYPDRTGARLAAWPEPDQLASSLARVTKLEQVPANAESADWS